MADFKANSFASQMQLLMETDPEIPTRFKQRIVFESSKVVNPFKFIARLFSKGVLCDGSDESEASFGLKETLVQLALIIGISKGAAAISGLMEALEESGNSELVSALLEWVVKDSATGTHSGLSLRNGDNPAVQTSTTETSAKQKKNTSELSSAGTKLIDMIMSNDQNDLMKQLEDQLVGKACEISNAEEFISYLKHQNMLNESDQPLNTGQEGQEEQSTVQAIKSACSAKSIGTLIAVIQHSGNEHILKETLGWLQISQATSKNYPIAVKSLAQQTNDDSNVLRSTFFEQPAPLTGLEKVATFNCNLESTTQGTLALKFGKDTMIAYLADGKFRLWDWRANEEKTIKVGVNVERITSFVGDEEIFVVGTAGGTVHLFDGVTLDEKWSVRLGEPVISLKFVESTLIVHTRGSDHDTFRWLEISRLDMRLIILKPFSAMTTSKNSGFVIAPAYSFLFNSKFVTVHATKSGIITRCGYWLESPADISTLNVVDLITTKTNVIAGCSNGLIALWNNCLTASVRQAPFKTLRGHSEAIVSLCTINGHLLSLDKSGRLLMWSGYDLEHKEIGSPVPRVLSENFFNVTILVAHERWLASGSSEDAIVNIWA